jgi:hypothetical protein
LQDDPDIKVVPEELLYQTYKEILTTEGILKLKKEEEVSYAEYVKSI